MAVEFFGMLDLYGLLVETVFGGVGLALLGVAVILIVIMAFSRMSFMMSIIIFMYYLVIVGIYYAPWTHFLIVMFALIYFFMALVRLIIGQ